MSEPRARSNSRASGDEHVRSERNRPIGLDELVGRFAREHRLGRNDDRQRVFAAWRRAAGPALLKQAWAARWRSGELLVEVGSAAHYHELTAFRGSELLARVNQELGRPLVRKLTFKPGARS